MAAANTAATSAAWQVATDVTQQPLGGGENVSTPRYPGAIETYHGQMAQAPGGGWTHGQAPVTQNAPQSLARSDPGEQTYGAQGMAEPAGELYGPVPGAGKPPNGVPGHDGYGGTAQVMARHGVDDGSAAWFGTTRGGLANISRWWNQITRRMPTDWRKVYDPQGMLENYEFDRPSLDIKPESSRDMQPHWIDYQPSPIYLKLAAVAQAQGAPPKGSYRAPYGYEPDMAGGQFTSNAGNPVYEEPPDPAVVSVQPQPVGYGVSDLYG